MRNIGGYGVAHLRYLYRTGQLKREYPRPGEFERIVKSIFRLQKKPRTGGGKSG